MKKPFRDLSQEERRRKTLGLLAIVGFVLAMAALTVYLWPRLTAVVKDPAMFREWVSERGMVGRLAFVGMVVLQVVIAVLPGEPFEIAAGYAFGFWEGTALCMLGIILGSAIVFLFVKHFGMKAVTLFFSREQIDGIAFLKPGKRLNLMVFILFLIPGTPKDIMTYAVGLTRMKLSVWLLISMTARIPSVVTSTIGGDAIGLGNYTFAIWMFAAALAISGIGLLIYRKMSKEPDK